MTVDVKVELINANCLKCPRLDISRDQLFYNGENGLETINSFYCVNRQDCEQILKLHKKDDSHDKQA